MSTSAPQAVFLSYASQDAEAAKRVCDALRAAGIEVWFDQNELVGGDAWDAKIRKQIAECALFVPVVSAETQARREGYFRIEWRLAAQRTHAMSDDTPFLLPVVIDDTRDVDARVPAEFKAVQWTRLPAGETPPTFCARVTKLLTGDAPDAPATAPGRLSATASTGRAANPAPAPATRRPWLRSTALGAAAVATVTFAVWQPWRTKSTDAAANHDGKSPSLQKAAAPHASLPEVRQLLAKAWTQLNKTELARAELATADELCRRALALDPNDVEALATASQVDSWLIYHNFENTAERRESARTRAARALQLAPDSFESRLAQACFLTRARGNWGVSDFANDAETTLATLLREKPDEPRALLTLGILQRNLGKLAECRATFARLAENPAYTALAWNETGWAEFGAGNYAAMEAAADRSIAVQPYWANLSLRIVVALDWRGDPALALSTLARMPGTHLLEDHGASTAMLVHLYNRDSAKALRVLGDVPRVWLGGNGYAGPKAYYAGCAHQLAGREAAAQVEWRAALKLVDQRLVDTPNSSELLWWKATLQAAQGDRSAAEATFRVVRELNPNPPPIFEAYDALSLQNHAAAIAHLERAAAQGPKVVTAAMLRLEPRFDPLRADPRFQALVNRLAADPRFAPAAAGTQAQSAPAAPAPAPNEKSLVVLPLENLSPDPANAFFTDGMHAEIIATLQAVPELDVKSREHALALKREGGTAAEIARRAGAAYSLAGSVRREGTKVRVLLDLRRTSDGVVVWSAPKVTRELKEALQFQSEVAEEVSRVLQARFDKGAFAGLRVLATDPRAYDLYLKAHHHYLGEVNDSASILTAVRMMEEGMKIDPNYMPGARLLGRMYIRAFIIEQDQATRLRFAAEGRKWAERASQLMPGGAGDPALAFYYTTVEPDAQRSLVYAENAIRALPNDMEGHHAAGLALRALGRGAEALERFQRSEMMDPVNSPSWFTHILLLSQLRRVEACRSLIAEVPRYHGGSFPRSASVDIETVQFRLDGSLVPQVTPETPRALRANWYWRTRHFQELVELIDAWNASQPQGDRLQLSLLLLKFDGLQRLGRHAEAKTIAQAALGATERLNALPEVDAWSKSIRSARIWSRLGRADEAMAAARAAVDATVEPNLARRWENEIEFAEVCARLNRPRECVELLAKLLRVPSGITVPMLKVDPAWDHVRDDAGFKALLADPKNSAPL